MADSRLELPYHEEYAAETFVGTAWAAIKAAGGLFAPPAKYSYFPEAFDPSWIAATPLRTEDSQKVTLAADLNFEEYTPTDADRAYHEQRRTKIYGRFQTDWLIKAAEYLMLICKYQVIFTAYESLPEDKRLGPHTDEWLVLAAQWRGKKAWRLGLAACEECGDFTLTTEPGDILVMPKDYPHEACTPSGSNSLHLAVGIRTNCPI